MRTYKKKMTTSKGATSNAEQALYKQGFKAVKPKRKPPGLKSKSPRSVYNGRLGVMSDFEQKLFKRGK
jgi:hypothetical protein